MVDPMTALHLPVLLGLAMANVAVPDPGNLGAQREDQGELAAMVGWEFPSERNQYPKKSGPVDVETPRP